MRKNFPEVGMMNIDNFPDIEKTNLWLQTIVNINHGK
jgi:hypothetical protein